MTINSAPADGSPDVSPAAPTVVSSAPPSWPWRRAALFLAGAAQLITISALVRADPIPATWSSLLLAVAPAPLAAAVFAPSPVSLLAAVAGIAVPGGGHPGGAGGTRAGRRGARRQHRVGNGQQQCLTSAG